MNFKVGDLVYVIDRDTRAHILRKTRCELYPMQVNVRSFTTEGKLYESNIIPTLVHATEKNRKRLNKLFGVEFEKPNREGSNE